MKIRSHLVALVFVALLPVLVFSSVMVDLYWRQQRLAFDQRFLERVDAITIALDRELEGHIRMLQVLGLSPHLSSGNLRAFHEEAARVREEQRTWAAVLLMDPAGLEVINLRLPFGAPLPKYPDLAGLTKVLAEGHPGVSRLYTEPVRGESVTAVVVPVRREGAIRYLLAASMNQKSWLQFLSKYPDEPDATVTLLDQDGIVIARTLHNDRWVGKRASPALYEESRKSPRKAYRNIGLEGQWFYTAHTRSAVSGWTVASGVPVAGVEAALRGSTIVVVVGLAAAAAFALGLAFVFGRRIAEPVAALARSAEALAAGTRVESGPVSAVTEVADVTAAFESAAERLRGREAALRESEERARRQLAEIEAVYRTASVGLCVVDPEFRYVRVNDRLAEMHGRPAAEHIGRTMREIIPGLADELEALVRRVLETGRPVFDVEVTGETFARPGLKRTWIEQWLPLFDQEGRVVAVNGAAMEVTERKDAEAERAMLLTREQAARAEAEAANRAKDEFLAMLGHELRNPLGIITTAVLLLDSIGSRDQQASQVRAVITRQAQHLARLVDDLLDVARVVAGKVVLDRQPVNLAEIAERAVSGLRGAGKAERHTVEVETTDVWLEGDSLRLEQVVGNLVTNALKYTPSGGTIRVTAGPEGGEAVLRVEDSGVGIPGDLLPRIFDLFVQGEQTLERSEGGLGIGLTLTKRLVALHGGRIEAASRGAGTGSVFTVRLPMIARRPLEPRLRGADAAGAASPRRVLVIEDNRDAREIMRELLVLGGHTVFEAEDGPGGVEAALRLRPDLVLIDIGLPGLDGYEVARRIRAGADGFGMALVAISGYGQSDDRQRSRAAGIDAHLVKPIDSEKLAKALALARDLEARRSPG